MKSSDQTHKHENSYFCMQFVLYNYDVFVIKGFKAITINYHDIFEKAT